MKTTLHRLIAAAILLCLILLTGCESSKPETLWAAKPSVMIDGVLYGTTGRDAIYRTDETPENGGRVDGEITSTVELHEYPTENDQSNFGTGFPYRFGDDNTVEIFFAADKCWIIYEAYETQDVAN